MKAQLRLIKNVLLSHREAGLLRHWIQKFIKIKKRQCRGTTIKTYSSVLNGYADFVGDDHWPPSWEKIADWFDYLENQKVSETTIHSYWIQLRTFLNFLEKIEALEHKDNPTHSIYKLGIAPSKPDLDPVAFPPEDLNTIFEYLESLAKTNNREAIRNRALIRFSYVTGIREAGVSDLRLSHLDIDNRCVHLPARTNKSKRRHRPYFDDQVASDLEAWLVVRPQRDEVDNVFVSLRGCVGAPISPKGIYSMLQRVCKAAGINRRKFHALRHSSALDALESGISVDKVQKQLGHANLQTTMNYLRGRDEDRARAYQERSLSENLARLAATRQMEQYKEDIQQELK
ncbi:MAG: tyrosine-type recombinase/integrase [Anaerolineae bacterium]|nr:tyrosine-type recombinase/integrase [Anaerolineae bacterium]